MGRYPLSTSSKLFLSYSRGLPTCCPTDSCHLFQIFPEMRESTSRVFHPCVLREKSYSLRVQQKECLWFCMAPSLLYYIPTSSTLQNSEWNFSQSLHHHLTVQRTYSLSAFRVTPSTNVEMSESTHSPKKRPICLFPSSHS